MTKAFIAGCTGETLSADERAFFTRERPWGLILFARNCKSGEQIRALVEDFRSVVGVPNAPVLIDQEGGRVRRLRPPLVDDYPAGAVYGRLFAASRAAGERAAHLGGRLIGADLAELGITVDCAPILDVPTPLTSDAIGDRAYGSDADTVAQVGRAFAEGLMASGVLPVVKHMPGHGRASVDSHCDLPVVDADPAELAATDFTPFRALADLPMGMTAHVVFTALDSDCCATQSRKVIDGIVRGQIGFDGLLMSDDLSMKALGGGVHDRVAKLFAAGCDMALHCNGDMGEMIEVARATPVLAGEAERRARAALATWRPGLPFDRVAARSEYEALLAEAAALS